MKRLALQNKQVEALRMAFRARKVLGTFGPVVQKLINANPRLKILPRRLFLYSQLLFNADIRQNLTSKKAILKNKNQQKKFSPKS